MQITFDPTNQQEAEYVLRMLVSEHRQVLSQDFEKQAEEYAAKLRRQGTVIAPEDNPETGAPAPGDIPLPPAVPSTAAADVFPIVPAAPGASIPPPPTVPPAPAPAAPPPAAAPTASPAAPSTHASGVQLDKNGLPHDPRIHSEKPTMTESGVWRKKRGLNDAAFVARIEAELRALMALPATGVPAAPSAAPLPPIPPTVPPVAGVPPVSPAPVSAVPPAPSADTANVPPPPATPAIPPAPPVPPVPAGASSPTIPPAPPVAPPASTLVQAPTTFAELMTLVTRNITQRKLTEEEVHVELRKVGLGDNDIGKLNLRMDLGAVVGQNLANLINSRGG